MMAMKRTMKNKYILTITILINDVKHETEKNCIIHDMETIQNYNSVSLSQVNITKYKRNEFKIHVYVLYTIQNN